MSDLDKNTEIPRGVSHILEVGFYFIIINCDFFFFFFYNKIIAKNKSVNVMAKIFIDCEVIIFDIENTNLDEIKFAL